MRDVHEGIAFYLIGGILVTLAGGVLFTNAIEFVGHRLRWTGSFTGAVVAPVVTSSPELILFLVAVLIHGGKVGEEIGIGTLLGQPFMAATIVYPMIVAIAVIGYLAGRRDDTVLEVERVLVVPYLVFTLLYPLVLIPTFLTNALVKAVVGALVLASYFAYTYVMYKQGGEIVEEVEEVYFNKVFRRYPLLTALLQLATSVALIFYGAKMMVYGIDLLSRGIRASPMAMAILISPLATVLPESITAVIWTIRNRDTMAVGALIGEKVLYSTFYPAIGVLFTSWSLDIHAIVSIVIVEVVSLIMLYYVWRGRIGYAVGAIGLAGYLAYAGYVVWI